jgi:hypothetical protein
MMNVMGTLLPSSVSLFTRNRWPLVSGRARTFQKRDWRDNRTVRGTMESPDTHE